MKTIEYKRKITKIIKFCNIFDDNGKFLGGGILNNTSHIEKELWVDVQNEPTDIDNTQPFGKYQIHIGSSKNALYELGVFLIGMSMFEPVDEEFSLSFDITDREAEPVLHLVVHTPIQNVSTRKKFSTIHTTGIKYI
jgi:hypothetical protein